MQLLSVSIETIALLLMKIWYWKEKSLHPQGNFPLLFFSVFQKGFAEELTEEMTEELTEETAEDSLEKKV